MLFSTAFLFENMLTDRSDKDYWIKIEVEQGYSEFFLFNLAMLPFSTPPN